MQYLLNGSRFSRVANLLISVPLIDYDDIVDRSTFSLDADREEVRRNRLIGSSSVGSYDDTFDLPSDLEVKIRTGKLDKAELSQMQRNLKKGVKDNLDNEKQEEIKEKSEKISKARQEFLDKQTGFDVSMLDKS